jgi:hypothetical protein
MNDGFDLDVINVLKASIASKKAKKNKVIQNLKEARSKNKIL